MSANVINIGRYVYPLITNALSEAGHGDVSVHAVLADKNTKGDYVVFARDRLTEPQTSMGGRSAILQVYVYTSEYKRGIDIAEVVAGALVSGDTRVELQMATEAVEDGLYLQAMEFNYNFF